MKNWKKRIVIGLFICILGIGGASYAYVSDYYHADAAAMEALQSDEAVQVIEKENQVIFQGKNSESGIIFYPGGKVEYTAYAPLLHQLAEEGMTCILLHMPGNLAVLDTNAADGIQEQYPEIETWYMAGHSLGGSMAASYIGKHTEEFQGLILLAAYSTEDLSDTDLDVLSLYGSEDGVLNREKYKKYKPNLPQNTKEYRIEGGNHGQFGSYGFQDGDGKAEISAEEQVERTVDEILKWKNQ